MRDRFRPMKSGNSAFMPAAISGAPGGMSAANRCLHLRLEGSFAPTQEARMTRSAIRLVILAMFLAAPFAASPPGPALAAGGGGDPPSATPPPPDTRSAPAGRTSQKPKKKPTKQSSVEDPGFASGYRAAYATIYDRHDYAAAIDQLKA